MRRLPLLICLAALPLGACVQTKQYADVDFTPPQGSYKLLVMRPDVSVGSVTTGGMVEPRADWTETGARQSGHRLEGAAGDAGRQCRHHGTARQPARHRPRHGRRARAAALCGRPVDRAAPLFRPLSADQARQGARLDVGRGCRAPRPEHRHGLCLVPLRRGQFRLDRPGRASSARRRRLLRRLLRTQHRRRRAVRLCLAGRSEVRRGRLVQRPAGGNARSPASTWATSASPRARRKWSTGCSTA